MGKSNYLSMKFTSYLIGTHTGFKFDIMCKDPSEKETKGLRENLPITNNGTVHIPFAKEVSCSNSGDTVKYRLQTDMVSKNESQIFAQSLEAFVVLSYAAKDTKINPNNSDWIDTNQNSLTVLYRNSTYRVFDIITDLYDKRNMTHSEVIMLYGLNGLYIDLDDWTTLQKKTTFDQFLDAMVDILSAFNAKFSDKYNIEKVKYLAKGIAPAIFSVEFKCEIKETIKTEFSSGNPTDSLVEEMKKLSTSNQIDNFVQANKVQKMENSISEFGDELKQNLALIREFEETVNCGGKCSVGFVTKFENEIIFTEQIPKNSCEIYITMQLVKELFSAPGRDFTQVKNVNLNRCNF